ncbi:MAG TPA: hypothetical protein VHM20_07745 [Gammaproteobacteria bacterium]|nr:hypothetical protein [Gammaproteobacteria bacterium]
MQQKALQEKLAKEQFLLKVYGESPIYFREIKKNDEQSERPLTLQIKKLISGIKLEYYKEKII